MIHLGYEIGTGKPVEIPLAHMAVTGQTQASGKTTTLEALIHRGNLRAVVFITKPGEKSFTEGRRILPYFKERADWEYVKDLLESRTGQRIGEKVGYLMRVCSRAKSLQEVRDNIDKELGKRDKDLQKTKRYSSRPSVHEVLAGYIDLILLELQRVPYTEKLELERGVNIMDLSGIDENIQDMVIRSVVDRIHHHERNTVVVVPEAWKIIPEGGRSLVFEALHGLIREGATNGNFVWIDAQDLAIVNKRILKSVTVWILGKQQEANEVVRTIRHLIAPVSILPDQIKTLGIGEFLACFDTSTRQVYVQPRWLGELDAMAIAIREETVEMATRIFREKKRHGEIKGVKDARAEPPRLLQTLEQEIPDENTSNVPAAGSRRSETEMRLPAPVPASYGGAGLDELNDYAPRTRNRQPEKSTPIQSDLSRLGSPVTDHQSPVTDREDEMYKERCQELEKEVARLRGIILARKKSAGTEDPPAGDEGAAKPSRPAPSNGFSKEKDVGSYRRIAGAPKIGEHALLTFTDFDLIYNEIKRRATDDPGIMQLLAERPELRVKIEPKVLEVDEDSARGQVAKLIHEGFFKEPRNGNTACEEILEKRRFKGARVSVYRALDDIAGMGFLIKDKSGFVATGMKVSVTGGR